MAKPPQSFTLSCWLGRSNLMEHLCCPLTACRCCSHSCHHPHQSMHGCVSCGPEWKVWWDKKSGETKSLMRQIVWWDEKSDETKSLVRRKVWWDETSRETKSHDMHLWAPQLSALTSLWALNTVSQGCHLVKVKVHYMKNSFHAKIPLKNVH